MSLLDVKHLSIHYHTPTRVIEGVRDVSFTVDPGEVLGVVGESGCGKSTMAHALIRLLSSEAQIVKGEIIFKSENLVQKSEKELCKIRGRHISMIFQNPLSSLNPTLTIAQQLTEGPIHHLKMNKKNALEYAHSLLEQVGIPYPADRLFHYPHQLSGGMRQRVLIAIALACHPSLLIADEPTTALDPAIQSEILDLLKTIQKKNKMGILLITHDLNSIDKICNRTIVMYAGKIVEIAPTSTLLSAPKHPYTQALINTIPKMDTPTGQLPNPIPGSPPYLSPPPLGCPFTPRCPHAMQICPKYEPPLQPFPDDTCCTCWNYHPEKRDKM